MGIPGRINNVVLLEEKNHVRMTVVNCDFALDLQMYSKS
jgi:hypothetical protein